MPAIQKCRTCVQPYRGDRYTGTHVRLFSLDSLFYLTIQTDTVTPLSLCFGLFILSLYTKEKRIVCEIGRYCNSREKRAVIIAKMQRAGQCPPGTSVVVRSRESTFLYTLVPQANPFLRKEIAATRKLSHKKAGRKQCFQRAQFSAGSRFRNKGNTVGAFQRPL